MKRRDAIKQTAIILGGTLSAGSIMGVMSGCKAEPTLDWKPTFLSSNQAALVAEIAETILPATNTPGAKDVGVPKFIDEMLNGYTREKDKQGFIKGLETLEKTCNNAHGKSFMDFDATEKKGVLTAFMNKAKEEKEAQGDTSKLTWDEKPAKPFFDLMKEITCLGYFTSETVGTEVLRYDPVPGVYNGCIPLAPEEHSWSI